MTGRGIDQVLPYACDPVLYEPYVRSAEGYVRLAEEVGGPLPRPVSFAYIWGDALEEFERVRPDLRLINLETAVTRSDDYWPGKGINYRMSPENIPCLQAAKIEGCALANNHVLDWGYRGLAETLESLRAAGIKGAGAGRNLNEAEAPAVFELEGKGRVSLFSFGTTSSGIPQRWAATRGRPGVKLLPDLSSRTLHEIGRPLLETKERGDIVIASIHWGGNWVLEIPAEHRRFAHGLIKEAGVDIVHGHSSHHVLGIEVYHGRLILYGCGDFLNDYEGIAGYEAFRADLSLMYFAGVEPANGALIDLTMTPTQIRRFRVNRASRIDAQWLAGVLNREGRRFGTSVVERDDRLVLQWR